MKRGGVEDWRIGTRLEMLKKARGEVWHHETRRGKRKIGREARKSAKGPFKRGPQSVILAQL